MHTDSTSRERVDDCMPYGNDSTKKAKNTLRISLANTGGFPISADDEKNNAIRQFVIENDIDNVDGNGQALGIARL